MSDEWLMNRRERRRLKKMRQRDSLGTGRATYEVVGETTLIGATLQQALTFLQAGQERVARRSYCDDRLALNRLDGIGIAPWLIRL